MRNTRRKGSAAPHKLVANGERADVFRRPSPVCGYGRREQTACRLLWRGQLVNAGFFFFRWG